MSFSINFIRSLHLWYVLLGAILLFLLFLKSRSNGKSSDKELGLIFIIVALLSWVAIDLFKILRETMMNESSFQPKLLSLLNNACLLASLPYFEHGFQNWKEKLPFFRNTTRWILTVFLLNVFLIILYLLFWEGENQQSIDFIDLLDVGYSIISMGLFGYALCASFYKRGYGISFLSLTGILMAFVIFSQLNYLPGGYSEENPEDVFYLLASHIGFVFLLIIHAQSLDSSSVEKEIRFQLQEKELELAAKNARLKQQGSNPKKGDETQKPFKLLEAGTYLKFYKEEALLVVEITILSKGIVGAKVFSKLNREYKDLLKFALYKKSGREVKAYSGIHKDFGGDIYKSVSDIRKRFLNPTLEEFGFPKLEQNELILQKLKGSGIYELNCLPENIIIDRDSLTQLRELEQLLTKLLPESL